MVVWLLFGDKIRIKNRTDEIKGLRLLGYMEKGQYWGMGPVLPAVG